MKGVTIYKAEIAHKDKRRTIMPICNGTFTARQMKIIEVKKGNTLGNHYHKYGEIRYLQKGKAKYFLKNMVTEEEFTFTMTKGWVMITEPWIAHTATFTEDSTMIEGTEEEYISAEHNDIVHIYREGKWSST